MRGKRQPIKLEWGPLLEGRDDAELLGFSALQRLLGDPSRVTIWRMIKRGDLPAPVKLPGSILNRWSVGSIRRVLASLDDRAA